MQLLCHGWVFFNFVCLAFLFLSKRSLCLSYTASVWYASVFVISNVIFCMSQCRVKDATRFADKMTRAHKGELFVFSECLIWWKMQTHSFSSAASMGPHNTGSSCCMHVPCVTILPRISNWFLIILAVLSMYRCCRLAHHHCTVTSSAGHDGSYRA